MKSNRRLLGLLVLALFLILWMQNASTRISLRPDAVSRQDKVASMLVQQRQRARLQQALLLATTASAEPTSSLAHLSAYEASPNIPEWMAKLYKLVGKPAPANTLVVAYCFYEQGKRQFDPLGQSRFVAEFLAPHISPQLDHRAQIEYRAVVALGKFLPPDVAPNSELGLTLLGLSSDVHVRICSFGSTEIMRILNSVPGVEQTEVSVAELQRRLKTNGQWWENLQLGEVSEQERHLWSHDGMLFWPPGGKRLRFPTLNGTAFGPFIPRFNKEPWFESVPGVTAQFDTKRETLSTDSITVYYPMILDTMSWRLTANEFPNHWSSRVGFVPPNIKTIRQALTRPPDFAPPSKKPFFMTSINSHCASPNSYMRSVIIRELFAFAVFDITKRAVHFLGNCPLGENRRRAGPMDPLAISYRHKSAVEAMAQHKFSIVFENSKTSGYFTEKIVNAYLAESIPVYFGPERAQVEHMLNVRAFIHCDLPANLTSTDALRRILTNVCQRARLSTDTQQCHQVFSAQLEHDLRPHFAQCIDQIKGIDQDEAKYMDMLSQPLINTGSDGELIPFWSGKAHGQAVRVLMQAFGYKNV